MVCFPISFQRLAGTPPASSESMFRAGSHPQNHQRDSGSDNSSDEAIISLLPPALREIVSLFQSVDDNMAKYQQLLHYGKELPPLDPRFKNNNYRVSGCVSQVWVRAFPDPVDSSAVRFEADSDAIITKGLAALLVIGLSGSTPSAIACVPPEFIRLLGLQHSLSPSRNNGFLNMLHLMKKKAQEVHNSICVDYWDDEDKNLSTNVNGWRPLDYAASKEKMDGFSPRAGGDSLLMDKDLNFIPGNIGGEEGLLCDEAGSNTVLVGHVDDEDDSSLVDGEVSDCSSSLTGGTGGRGERIKMLLEGALYPVELDIEDVSHLHAGHAGIEGRSGETHFNVHVVSKEFEGKSMVKRHRLVFDLLQEELQSGLHALSIVAKAPSEIN
ncbi:hypothetical protein HPP92_020054 [Vanilla planifolia]|uniref:Fe-S metabolism associated domain-containing protein n=1 Tax=Vanilla planifolia TaxID=51239 RepID=A0A835Q414_VANPL|nr:hypothetical protein HPP92_020054 [Vanilla planifolia]